MTSLMTVPRVRVVDPFRSMRERAERMFDEFFGDVTARSLVRFAGREREWETVPKCDVTETAGEYTLRAEVPGFAKEDIQVDVSESSVTLRGERKEEKRTEGESYVCRESTLGSFERTIGLPETVNVDGVKATLKDGVLTLHLPRTEVQHLKKIEVQSA